MPWTEITSPQYRRPARRYASDLTDTEWALVAPFMPAPARLGRPRSTDLRSIVDALLPVLARRALCEIVAALEALDRRIEKAEAAILSWHKGNERSRKLAAIPGTGPITASALVATVGDARQFGSARQFAAWLAGLVPKQNSSGGRQQQGGISKQGDRYFGRLLVMGATAVIRFAPGPAGATPPQSPETAGPQKRFCPSLLASSPSSDGESDFGRIGEFLSIRDAQITL